ncbi:MAG: helix-turn-helix domain-containing protein [Prevotella sp.]
MRIEYAKRLMTQHPQLRVQEVFEASGFQSLSHFTRIFTVKEGCSPSKWRNNR